MAIAKNIKNIANAIKKAQPAQPVKAPPPQQIPTSRTTISPPVNAAKKLQPAQPVARPQPVTSPTPSRGLAKLPPVVQQRAQQAIQQARPIQQQLPPAMTPPQARLQPVTPPPPPVRTPYVTKDGVGIRQLLTPPQARPQPVTSPAIPAPIRPGTGYGDGVGMPIGILPPPPMDLNKILRPVDPGWNLDMQQQMEAEARSAYFKERTGQSGEASTWADQYKNFIKNNPGQDVFTIDKDFTALTPEQRAKYYSRPGLGPTPPAMTAPVTLADLGPKYTYDKSGRAIQGDYGGYNSDMIGNQQLWNQYNDEARQANIATVLRPPGYVYGGGYENWVKGKLPMLLPVSGPPPLFQPQQPPRQDPPTVSGLLGPSMAVGGPAIPTPTLPVIPHSMIKPQQPPDNPNYSVELGVIDKGPTNPLTGQLIGSQPPNNPDASVRDFDAFYQSPEFQNYVQQQTQTGGFGGFVGTSDMYDSPYFGQQGSGSIGRAQDAAYEQYLRRTGQTNVLSQSSQLGYQGQPGLGAVPVGMGLLGPMPGVTQPATQAQITSITTQPRIF